MCKPALDLFDMRPQAMDAYLSNYGWHFSKELCEYAVSLMYSEDASGVKTYTKLKSKDEVKAMAEKLGVKLHCAVDYDFLYTFHAYCTDLKGVVLDEKLLLMITDAICNDADAGDGAIMRKWLATMVSKGEPVYWSDFA